MPKCFATIQPFPKLHYNAKCNTILVPARYSLPLSATVYRIDTLGSFADPFLETRQDGIVHKNRIRHLTTAPQSAAHPGPNRGYAPSKSVATYPHAIKG